MRYHSINVNNNELENLNKLYKKHLVDVNDEKVYFAAIHNNVRIHAYKDGTIILSGRNMNDEYLTLKKFLKERTFKQSVLLKQVFMMSLVHLFFVVFMFH